MTNEKNRLDDFLKRVDHSIARSTPSNSVRLAELYHSLEFSCLAAKSGSEWVLIAGRAALSTNTCLSNPSISPVYSDNEFVALHGGLSAQNFEDLLNNLKNSEVVGGLQRYNVRLMPQGPGEFVWQGPVVRLVDTKLYPWTTWKSELWIHGSGGNVFPLLAPWWDRVDERLIHNRPRFNGLNGLCRKLRIPLVRDHLNLSFFNISAELPAQFVSIHEDRKAHTLEVDFECVGTPLLMKQWLPEGDLDLVEWQNDPETNRQHVSLGIPPGSAEVELLLSFEVLGQADALRYRVAPESTLIRIAEYFDPQQTRLQEFLNKKTDADANAFELGVARLLSTGGFVVQWFGKASKEALPDIVALWRSSRGEEQLILAECTMRDPTGKLTDLMHRRRVMSDATGIALDRIRPVLFLRTSATSPDFKAAADRGIVLCDASRLNELQQLVMSGHTPPELCATLRAWGRSP